MSSFLLIFVIYIIGKAIHVSMRSSKVWPYNENNDEDKEK